MVAEYSRRYLLFNDVVKLIEEVLANWLEDNKFNYCIKHCTVNIYREGKPNSEIFLEDIYNNDLHLDELMGYIATIGDDDLVCLKVSECIKTSEDTECILKQRLYHFRLK